MDIFPRKPTLKEKELLFSVLPESKTGYKKYRDKIDKLFIIGYGRFGGSNLILGKKEDKPDLNLPSTPIFAIGTIEYDGNEIDIIIHEEIDDEIEFDLSVKNPNVISANLREIKRWNFSEWMPGDGAPNDNSYVREVSVISEKFILAVAPELQKIWVNELANGVNHIIPVSNFYNHLMLTKKIRDAQTVLNPNLLFKNLSSYEDKYLVSAFLMYNKYFRRVIINETEYTKLIADRKKKNIFSYFKKG